VKEVSDEKMDDPARPEMLLWQLNFGGVEKTPH